MVGRSARLFVSALLLLISTVRPVASNPPAPPDATICRFPTSLEFRTNEGLDTAAGVGEEITGFRIWNCVRSTLNYSITDDASDQGSDWLSVSPTTGTSTGGERPHTVTFNTEDLTTGTYTATITISATAGTDGSPPDQTIAVTVYVLPTFTLTITDEIASDPTTRLELNWPDQSGTIKYHVLRGMSSTAIQALADMDGDGDLDMVGANENLDRISWYENSGGLTPYFRYDPAIHTIGTDTDGPEKIGVGDFNGDGAVDVVVTSTFDRKLYWYKNDGAASPSFTRQNLYTYTGNDLPLDVHVADIDGDGDLDAVVSSTSDTLRWFDNDGTTTPSFTSRVVDSALPDITAIHTGDLDGDGELDILAASRENAITEWYENDGSSPPTFTKRVFHDPDSHVTEFAVADFDNDGDLDAVGSVPGGAKMKMYVNNGASPPTFTAWNVDTPPIGSSHISVGDINGDGLIDILNINFGIGGDVSWYENTGGSPASFTNRILFSGSSFGLAILAGDLDGDGDLDAVWQMQLDPIQQDLVYWEQNDGAATPAFTRKQIQHSTDAAPAQYWWDSSPITDNDPTSYTVSKTLLTPDSPYSYRVWALNSSDAPIALSNAVTAETQAMTLSSVVARPDVATSPTQTIEVEWPDTNAAEYGVYRSVVAGPFDVVPYDLNGDGADDLLAASGFDGDLVWYESDSATDTIFSYRPADHTITDGPSSIVDAAAADLDGDGDLDVIPIMIEGNKTVWYANSGGKSPTFSEQVISTNTLGTATMASISSGDIDGDGDMDFVVTLVFDDEVVWYENDGATTPGFTKIVVSSAMDGAFGSYVADLNADGDLDIIASAKTGDKITWYESDGTSEPTFTERTIDAAADGPASIVAADINGDSDLDIAVSMSDSDTIAWYESSGGSVPTFTKRIISTALDWTHFVDAADMDGDGDQDVIGAGPLDDTVAWFENNGSDPPAWTAHYMSEDPDGFFNPLQGVADGARTVHASDLDGDGDFDVVTAAFVGKATIWFENEGTTFTPHVLQHTGGPDGFYQYLSTVTDDDSATYSYLNTGLAHSSDYSYKVLVINSAGTNVWSNTATTTTYGPKPPQPIITSIVTGDCETSVTIEWFGVHHTSHYDIYRTTEGIDSENFTLLATVEADGLTTHTFDDTDPTTGAFMCYTIIARNVTSESDMAAGACVQLYGPLVIEEFTVTDSGPPGSYAEVSWALSGPNLTTLDVFRKLPGESVFTTMTHSQTQGLPCLDAFTDNITSQTTCIDLDTSDTTVPTTPSFASSTPSVGGWSGGGSLSLAWNSATDASSGPYWYYIVASDEVCSSTAQSTTESVTITGGIYMYEIHFSVSSNPADTASYVKTAYVDGIATSTVQTGLPDGTLYAHVRAQDNGTNWSDLVTFGPWKFDSTPPAIPTLDAVVSALPEDSSGAKPVGATFDLDGTYPNHWDAFTSDVTIKAYAQSISSAGTLGTATEIKSQVVNRPAPDASVAFTLQGISTGSLDPGRYRVWLTASDDRTPANESGASNSKTVNVDADAPTFSGGLESIIPDRTGQQGLRDVATLTWTQATEAAGEAGVAYYEVFATTETETIDLNQDQVTTVTVDASGNFTTVAAAPYSVRWVGLNAQNKIELTLDGLSTETSTRWTARAVDAVGNISATGGEKVVYGANDVSLHWTLIADFQTSVSFGFDTDGGSTATAEMFLTGFDIDHQDGVTDEWIAYAETVQPLALHPTGIDEKRLFVQLRDTTGTSANHSVLFDRELTFVEPPVLVELDLIDLATSISLGAVTTLSSDEILNTRLVGTDQYGNAFTLDAAGYSATVDGNVTNVVQVAKSGVDFDITGYRQGICQVEVTHTTSTLVVSKGFFVGEAGLLASVTLEPAGPTRVESGGVVHFTATGSDTAGNPIEIDPIWFTGAVGSINRNGTLRAPITDNETTGTIRVRDSGNSVVFGEAEVIVDGRAPIVSLVEFDPPANGNGELSTDTLTHFKVQIPGAGANAEAALAAQYDLYVDNLFIGSYEQTTDTQTVLSSPAVMFDSQLWAPGNHSVKVVATDSLGNTNSVTPYLQTFKTVGGTPLEGGIDWLLVNQNLSTTTHSERGSWTFGGSNPSRDAATEPEEIAAASVRETAAAVLTLLDYDLGYTSAQINPKSQDYVTVRECLETALSYLLTVINDEVVSDPQSELLGVEAMIAGRGRGLVSRLIDPVSGLETAVADSFVDQVIRDVIEQDLRRDVDGGYSFSDEKIASRSATLMALKIGAQLDVADATMSDLGGTVLTNFYDTAAPVVDFLSERFDYDVNQFSSPTALADGYSLNQWDAWNENGIVFISSDMLQALAVLERRVGSSPELDALLQHITDFLATRRHVPSGGRLGFGDPDTQASTDTLTTATIATTAISLLGLREAGALSAADFQEGITYLRDEQAVDTSWRNRAFETALVLRLMRPDLEVASVPDPTLDVTTGLFEYVVTVANTGAGSAGAFVVSAHTSDPADATLDERRESSAATSNAVLGLAEGASTTVTLAVASGTATHYFMVDSEEAVVELDEANNILRVEPVPRPDLRVLAHKLRFGQYDVGSSTFTEAPILFGSTWAIEATVQNAGEAEVPLTSAFVEFYIGAVANDPEATTITNFVAQVAANGDGWPWIGSGTALAPGEEFTVVGTINFPYPEFFAAGTYAVSAVVQAPSLSELTTQNNSGTRLVNLYASPPSDMADLVISEPCSIEIVPAYPSVDAGDYVLPFAFKARVTVENIGGGSAVEPVVELWVDDAAPRRATVPGTIEAGQTFIVEFPLALNAPGAVIYVCVDPDLRIPEEDETNNCSDKPVGVPSTNATYDLAVAPQAGDISVERQSGGGWTLNVTVRNPSLVNYTGAEIPQPSLMASFEGASGPVSLFAPIDKAIGSGDTFTVSWRDVDFAVGAGPTEVTALLLSNTDATAVNDTARCLVYPSSDTHNLTVTGLVADPPIGRITTVFPPWEPTQFTMTIQETEGVGPALQNVRVWLLNDVTGEVIWSYTIPSLAAGASLPLTVRDLPMREGEYQICAVVDATGRVLETNELDNRDCVPLVVIDEIERVAPDLYFPSTEPVVFGATDSLTAPFGVEATVRNAVADVVVQASGQFLVRMTDEDTTASATLGETVVASLGDSESVRIQVFASPIDAQGQVKLRIDPDNAITEFANGGEANNILEFDLLKVPFAVNATVVSAFTNLRVRWADSALMDTEGYIGPGEFQGYRVSRFRDGALEASAFLPHADSIPSTYTLLQEVDAEQDYVYHIVTVSDVGLESLATTVTVTSGGEPQIRLLYEGAELATPADLFLTQDAETTVTVEVTAPGAADVLLYIDRTASVLEWTAGATSDTFLFVGVALSIGNNFFFAQPTVDRDGETILGPFTEELRVACRTGIDLTGSPSELRIEKLEPGALGWMEIGIADINTLSTGTALRFIARAHNVEDVGLQSDPFSARFTVAHVLEDGSSETLRTREVSVPEGPYAASPVEFYSHEPSGIGVVAEDYFYPLAGMVIARIQVDLDINDEVSETFEDNNRISLHALKTGLDSVGRRFVLAFLPNMNTGEGIEQGVVPQLHLTAVDVATTVTVSYPDSEQGGATVTQEVFIEPGTVNVMTLVPSLADGWGVPASRYRPNFSSYAKYAFVDRNAVEIVSDHRIAVKMITPRGYNTDGAMALPVESLGTDYRITTHRRRNIWAWWDAESFVIVAPYDNTLVTISSPIDLYKTPNPLSVLLNAGDAYLGRGDRWVHNLSGARITSTRPVAVLAGNQALAFNNSGAADNTYEFAAPTSSWGKSFAAVSPRTGVPPLTYSFYLAKLNEWPPAQQERSVDYFIVAAEDGTTVTMDGLLLGALNAGDRLTTTSVEGAHLIEASKPVSVMQYLNGVRQLYWIRGSGSLRVKFWGDPAATYVLPTDQFRSAYTVAPAVESNMLEHWLTIIADADDVASETITINGVFIDDYIQSWMAVFPDSEWFREEDKFTQIGTSGVYRAYVWIREEAQISTASVHAGHQAYQYGFRLFESYSFPSGTMARYLTGDAVVDDSADLAALFYDPAGSGGQGNLGFPGGTPLVGDTGRLVGRIENVGSLLAHGLEYRFRVDTGGGYTDLTAGWLPVPRLPPDPLDVQLTVLPGGMSVPVEIDWVNTLVGATTVTLALEVRSTDASDNPNNNLATLDMANSVDSTDYPNLAWGTEILLAGQPLPVDGSQNPYVPVRMGTDRALNLSARFVNENVLAPQVGLTVTGGARAWATTDTMGSVTASDAPEISPSGLYTNEDHTSGTVHWTLTMDYAAVNGVGANDEIGSTTLVLELNPSGSGQFPEGAPGVYGTANSLPGGFADNTLNVALPIVAQFHDVAVTRLVSAGSLDDGRSILEADVVRTTGTAYYDFTDVTVGLFDGYFEEDASGTPIYPTAEVLGLRKRLTWGANDPATKTIQFYWQSDGRTSVTLSVVADPLGSDLYERPGTGRANNVQRVSFEVVPGERNLSASGLSLLGASGSPVQFEQGEEGTLRLLSAYAADAIAPATDTYKVRFWDGLPSLTASTLVGEVVVLDHNTGTTVTVDQLWKTSSLAIGTEVIFAQIDPVDHVAAKAKDDPSTTPLAGIELWEDASITPAVARAAEAPEAWRITVRVAESEFSTTMTTIGQWDSTTTTLSSMNFAAADGPVLVMLEAVDTDSSPGDEWLPPLSAGDTIRIDFSIPELGGGTTTTLINSVNVALPASDLATSLGAVALWIASDGSTYFANSMHLATDFNYGTTDTAAVVDMTADKAMHDATGRVLETEEADNLAILAVDLIAATTIDMAIDAMRVVGTGHEPGDAVSLDIDLRNLVAAHNYATKVALTVVGGDALSTPTFGSLGGWLADESRTVTTSIDSTGLSGTVTLRADLVLSSDTQAANNWTTTSLTITGTATLDLKDLTPTSVDPSGTISFTVEPRPNPSFVGTVTLDVIDGSGATVATIADATLTSQTFTTTSTRAVSWNVGTISPGTYHLAGSLVEDATLTVRATDVSSTFTVATSLGLSAEIAAGRTFYDQGEPVLLMVSAGNPGLNKTLSGPTTVTVSVDGDAGGNAASFEEVLGDLAPGDSLGFDYAIEDLAEDEYFATVLATNSSTTPSLTAIGAAYFGVGPVGRRPGERVEFVDVGSTVSLDFTNTIATTVSLQSAGSYDMTSTDSMWLSSARKPLWETNLAINGDVSQEGATTTTARGWVGADRVAVAGGGWALELDPATTVSNATDPTVGIDRSESIVVAAGEDYAFSFEVQRSATTSTLQVTIRQYTVVGDSAANDIVTTLSSGDLNTFTRTEIAFTASPATRYVDVIFTSTGGGVIHLTSIQLIPGEVAIAFGNRTTDRVDNLVANPGFTIDTGIDLEGVHVGDLSAMDTTAANGVPDGWERLGGGTVTMTAVDTDLPTTFSDLGLTATLELDHDTGTTPAMEQRYIQIEPGDDLYLSFAAKGQGLVRAEQYDKDFNLLTTSTLQIDIDSTATWFVPSDAAGHISTHADARYLSLRIDGVPSSSTLKIAAMQVGPTTGTAWSGWIPYDPLIGWNLEDQDGAQSLHARYLSDLGVTSIESVRALTRDANSNGIPDRVPNAVVTMLTWDSGGTSTTIGTAVANDGDVGTSLSLTGEDSLVWTMDLQTMAYVDTIRVASNFATTATLKLSGSFDGWTYFDLIESQLAAGAQDLLLPAMVTYPRYRILIEDAVATATLSGTLQEIELRGLLFSGGDAIILDRALPSVALDATSPTLITTVTPSFTGSATDTLTGIGRVEYRVVSDGIPWTEQTNFDPVTNTFSLTTDALSTGTHTIEVRVVDGAGNVSSTDSQTVTIDTSPPTIQITAPANDSWTTAPVTVNWTSVDGDLATSTGVLRRADFKNYHATTDTLLVEGDTVSTDGWYMAEVYGTDNAGNDGPSTSTFFGIDNTDPVVTFTQYAPDPTNVTSISIVGNADEVGQVGLTTIEVKLNAGSWAAPTTYTLSTGDFRFDLTSLADGLHTVSGRATDLLGNASGVTTTTVTIDTAPPVMTIDQPTTGSWSVGPTTLIWSTVASDLDTSYGILTFTAFGGAQPTTQTIASDDAFTSQGHYNFTVYATDTATNPSAPVSVAFGIDLTSPTIAITAPPTTATLTADFDLEGTIVELEGSGLDTATAAYRFAIDGQTTPTWSPWTTLPVTLDSPGSYSFDETLDIWRFSDATYRLEVKAADNVSNLNTVSTTFAVDKDYPPAAPTGVSAYYTSDSLLVVRWNKGLEDDLVDYKLYRDINNGSALLESDLRNGAVSEVPGSEAYNEYADSVTTTTPSYYQYALKSVDLAGNVSDFSTTFTATVPQAPSELVAVAGDGDVRLDWTAVAENTGASYVQDYLVYRSPLGSSPDTTFTLTRAGDTPATTTYTDTSVSNGNDYTYYVVARDGAGNESLLSNIVTASPSSGVSTVQSVSVVTFEDLKNRGSVDWDYNDITVKLDITMELDGSDDVTTITITATAIEKDAGYTHKLNIDIDDLASTASVTILRYNNTDTEIAVSTDTMTYSSGASPMVMFPNTTTGVSGSGGVVGDVAIATIVLTDPGQNPYATFDAAPFDSWIVINEGTGDEQTVHIFDPAAQDAGSEDFEDMQLITDVASPLYGTYLSFGLKLDASSWTPPSSGTKLWEYCPDFIDFAKTMRTTDPLNPTWYLSCE